MLQRTLGKIRIIGGKWKRSVIHFDDADGLRPTGNRQRERLFNWLTTLLGDTEGKTGLDLFAGSGALSFEAVSRGFSRVVLFEKNKKNAQNIRSNMERLQASEMTLIVGDALIKANSLKECFDVVFLDPPFAAGLYEQALKIAKNKVKAEGLIYIESPKPIAVSVFEDLDLGIIRQDIGTTICMTLVQPHSQEKD